VNSFKGSIVKAYHYLWYREARVLAGTGISFDHFRELHKPWLLSRNVRTVLDVGANRGQFARLARKVFPQAAIHSFEPLPECFDAMKAALGQDAAFFPYNMAMGRKPTFLDFFRSSHSPSSSFLQMDDLHKEAFPESRDGQEQAAIRVEVSTLDGFYKEHHPEKGILLKIDVQGFEAEVLAGARVMLPEVSVVIIEMSIVKLYKDQPLFHDIYTTMHAAGFRYHGNLSQMLHPQSQEVVQIDAIFVNERPQ
jgi:FkbM family methyltransferase